MNGPYSSLRIASFALVRMLFPRCLILLVQRSYYYSRITFDWYRPSSGLSGALGRGVLPKISTGPLQRSEVTSLSGTLSFAPPLAFGAQQ